MSCECSGGVAGPTQDPFYGVVNPASPKKAIICATNEGIGVVVSRVR